MTMVNHAQGQSPAETYLINIGLPNNVMVHTLRVTKGVMTGFDVLIGMDVIMNGDFVITNKSQKTTFTFRMPSMAEIDFVQGTNSPRTGRNDPCSCNSGKKSKNCCGSGR